MCEISLLRCNTNEKYCVKQCEKSCGLPAPATCFINEDFATKVSDASEILCYRTASHTFDADLFLIMTASAFFVQSQMIAGYPNLRNLLGDS
jgi:hypothetical protein